MFQFLPTSSNLAQPLNLEEWTNIPQATINNLINSIWRRCEANVGHTRYWLVFLLLQTPPPASKAKLHISEWPFIVASLRHIYAIIMPSNQHLDMPHLWGGMDYLSKGEVLTNTDLDRFVNNIWEKWIFCVYRKSFEFSNWKMGSNNKCCLYFCPVYIKLCYTTFHYIILYHTVLYYRVRVPLLLLWHF